jgi:hypothetical protein
VKIVDTKPFLVPGLYETKTDGSKTGISNPLLKPYANMDEIKPCKLELFDLKK